MGNSERSAMNPISPWGNYHKNTKDIMLKVKKPSMSQEILPDYSKPTRTMHMLQDVDAKYTH
jgi:hypothetical protein